MKILICVENLVMDGLKRVSTVIGNELAKKIEVNYYSLSDGASFFKLTAPLITSKYPVNTGKSFRGKEPLINYQDQITDLIRVLKVGKYDAVILTAGLLTSFIPKIKNQLPNMHCVAWMHNSYETYMNNYYQFMKAEFTAGLTAADRVVVLTSHDLKGFSNHQTKSVLLYNPLTINVNQLSNLNNPVISMVSRIDTQQKGLDLLLSAANQLQDGWTIKLAGDGPDFNDLQKEIKRLGLESKLQLLGTLADQQLQEHYRTSSIFLMTSRWEGMPLVIGEAMNFGLPIISMYNTGAYEYLLDNKFGIITDDHLVADLVEKLNRLTQSKKARAYWADKSLKRSQSFLLQNIAAQWKVMLETI
ncbi:glycosyltransferase [Liquorilactobacillus mali]|uniref:glycosyltransferase n=1 Tax=Liquorilactobacillus mali TaxID=1618 RepID=UPI00234FE0C0|nr:glycosyltransferase [Liquorilactobacillus mali]MDC7953764.1 glycosyltransferase [Liquorilactobacillus mali]